MLILFSFLVISIIRLPILFLPMLLGKLNKVHYFCELLHKANFVLDQSNVYKEKVSKAVRSFIRWKAKRLPFLHYCRLSIH